MAYYSLTTYGERRTGESVWNRRTILPYVVHPTLLPYDFSVFEPGDEPTDVRPAPERDRPSEGCQLAVHTAQTAYRRRGPTSRRSAESHPGLRSPSTRFLDDSP